MQNFNQTTIWIQSLNQISVDTEPTGVEALIVRAVEDALSHARALVKSYSSFLIICKVRLIRAAHIKIF